MTSRTVRLLRPLHEFKAMTPHPDPHIFIARTDAEILDCFPVMSQLRTHLKRDEFVARVRVQMNEGYTLAGLRNSPDGTPVAVAGFRIGTNLAWGLFMYVDDLVTSNEARSQGHGRAVLDWLIAKAREEGCEQFHLDSGTQRLDAHRFYQREGMSITSHHFTLDLRESPSSGR